MTFQPPAMGVVLPVMTGLGSTESTTVTVYSVLAKSPEGAVLRTVMVFSPGTVHVASTVGPVKSTSLVGFPSSLLSTNASVSHENCPCWPNRLGVLVASRVSASPNEIEPMLSSVTVGVSGGANSIRTVSRRGAEPSPPPSGVSVLSATRSNSSPSSVDGTCHVTDWGDVTP